MEERQRFASFIATTNNLRPLTDPTGSRRFICVYAEEIDNSGIINYNQLYAQLRQELNEGRRYWFEDDDNQRIMEQNKDFQQVFDYEKMIELTFLPSEQTPPDAAPVPLKDIMSLLARKFPTFTVHKNTGMEVGHRLSAMGYKSHKLNSGAAYRMIEKAP